MEVEVMSAGQKKDSVAEEVRSNILKIVEEAQVEAFSELHDNLRQMVNNPAFSDVVFLCNDGAQVHASRILLAGRSAVLMSMLMSGMAESSLSEIELPEISSAVLLCVFEFLYTGSLSDDHVISWKLACEIIIASRFFLLPKLEMITRKFMINYTSLAAKDLPLAVSLLTEASRFKALCDEKDISLKELVTILSSNWSDSGCIRCLSEDAFQYLLTSTNSNFEVSSELSFEEYLRFRQVIRWWVCQNDDESARTEELLNFITPDEEKALYVYRNLEPMDLVEIHVEDAARLSNEWSSFQLDEVSRNSAARLLSSIDFRRIHPLLLAKVVEPLKILTSEELHSAFRFHALRQPKMIQRRECGWEHGESHETVERGNVIRKACYKTGVAVMMAAMSSSYALHQWHFIVEEIPYDFCELGFISTGEWAADKASLECEKLSDKAHARVLDYLVMGARIKGPGGRTEWMNLGTSLQKFSRAVFNFDAYKQTCSLILDGHDFGVIWKDIPKAIYYPAVSVGLGSVGRVRIELVSGFDIL